MFKSERMSFCVIFEKYCHNCLQHAYQEIRAFYSKVEEENTWTEADNKITNGQYLGEF